MFARTRRLTLRPGWPEDADVLTAAIAHESLVRMLLRAPWPYARSDAVAFLGRVSNDDEPHFLILSHESEYPVLVGGIGLHRAETGHELGYWLTPGAWGRGYATEAGLAVLEIAHHALGLERVAAMHFADNPASGGVLRKLGFRPTGVVSQRQSAGRSDSVNSIHYTLVTRPVGS